MGQKIVSKVSIERFDLNRGDVLEIVSFTERRYVVARNLVSGCIAVLAPSEFKTKEAE